MVQRTVLEVSNIVRQTMASRRQSKEQKDTVGRVMHEFKLGELETSRGRKVKKPETGDSHRVARGWRLQI